MATVALMSWPKIAQARLYSDSMALLQQVGVCPSPTRRAAEDKAEMELWRSVADRCWLQVDDAVHAAALYGVTYQRKEAGDEVGTDVAEVCERELIARLGRAGIAP